MIDRNLLRDQPAETIKKIHYKDPNFPAQELVSLDHELGQIQQRVEELRHKKNELAQQGKKGVTDELRAESIAVGKELKEKEARYEEAQKSFKGLYLSCPNICDDDIPVGNKEANKVVRSNGEIKKFSFEPKNHLELAEKLKWVDFAAGATIAGSQFPVYLGQGVELIYAMVMFMLKHNKAHGYNLVLPPALANEQSLIVSSNLPKFKDQVYEVCEDKLYLIPTAEVSLANIYRDQILTAEQLPIRMTAWTSCFRREAGGYGAHERGLIRMHQFEKAELFTICEPENSKQEQERMLDCAEGILKAFELPYRVSLLATQDCSFASARTYDLEVWLPGQKSFYEVSSISNCTDFQSRRGAIRYRKEANGKPRLVHTLNGSSLALSRVMVAILETYQQEDGSIALPNALKGFGI